MQYGYCTAMHHTLSVFAPGRQVRPSAQAALLPNMAGSTKPPMTCSYLIVEPVSARAFVPPQSRSTKLCTLVTGTLTQRLEIMRRQLHNTRERETKTPPTTHTPWPGGPLQRCGPPLAQRCVFPPEASTEL